MDISELLPILAVIVLCVTAAYAFRVARAIGSRLVRLVVRLSTGFLAASTLLLSVALIYFNINYIRHAPAQRSPDGSHLAITTYTINTGTADQAEVAVRHAWSPLAHRVYAGPAQFQSHALVPDPAVQWLDPSHLRIRFNTYASTQNSPDLTPQGCAAQADGVSIVCEQTLVHATR